MVNVIIIKHKRLSLNRIVTEKVESKALWILARNIYLEQATCEVKVSTVTNIHDLFSHLCYFLYKKPTHSKYLAKMITLFSIHKL